MRHCHWSPSFISIHSPLAGRDDNMMEAYEELDISIHSPLAGRDNPYDAMGVKDYLISIHSPLAGRDLT